MTDATPGPVWIEYMDIRDLVPDPDNPKDHDIGAIDESIAEFGFVNPMGINEETGMLIFGHGRLKGLLQKQARHAAPPPNITEQDGRWFAPVVRGLRLTPDRAKAYVIADNQVTFLGGWNEPKLLENLLQLGGPTGTEPGLRGTGFAAEDVDRLSRLLNPSDHEAGLHIDVAERLQKKWGTERGQLWISPSKVVEGIEHRIFCGDATSEADLARLMFGRTASLIFTDPPYGVDHVRHRSGKRSRPKKGDEDSQREHYEKIGGDALTGLEFEQFLIQSFKAAIPHMTADASWYIWHASASRPSFLRALEAVGVNVHQEIIWKKENFYIGRQDYHWQHEPCLYGWRDKHNFYGDRKQSTVWEVRRDRKMLHPTIKPVALYMIGIRNNTSHGEAVLDPFAGSGPIVLAAERTGRAGYALELSPKYVAVILQRCREMGMEPKLEE